MAWGRPTKLSTEPKCEPARNTQPRRCIPRWRIVRNPRTAGFPRWQSQPADRTDPRDRPANHPKQPQAPAGDHDRTDKRQERRRNPQGTYAAWNTRPHTTNPLRSSSHEHHYKATGTREHRGIPHIETPDSTCTTAANIGSTRNYELQKQAHRTNQGSEESLIENSCRVPSGPKCPLPRLGTGQLCTLSGLYSGHYKRCSDPVHMDTDGTYGPTCALTYLTTQHNQTIEQSAHTFHGTTPGKSTPPQKLYRTQASTYTGHIKHVDPRPG
ncbi:Hypothetical predicted protein [Pelobates cultripes]|uniref:Uncharacterized protein n=1 Tax=Pelobates cultripes TaxID=61616 RepID=A0AAD1S1K0_PELCU|nr:Hypothetical predicted protein [Pelobates cultripes]